MDLLLLRAASHKKRNGIKREKEKERRHDKGRGARKF